MKNSWLSVSLLAIAMASVAPLAQAKTTATDATAATVALGATTWTATGNAGMIGGDAVVGASPLNNTQFGYVSTAGGVDGTSPLVLDDTAGRFGAKLNQANGTKIVSDTFAAASGQNLTLYFDYVTSDGHGYQDYAWARLVNAGSNTTAAWLLTARSNNTGNGNTVPGGVLASQVDKKLQNTLDATINDGSTVGVNLGPSPDTQWAPLGATSWDTCFKTSTSCGSTGWVKSDYAVQADGSYYLEFGVTNWGDNTFDSALAFDFTGLHAGSINASKVLPQVFETPNSAIAASVPEPQTYAMLLAGLGLMGTVARRRKSKSEAA
jgi:hypothetical protein